MTQNGYDTQIVCHIISEHDPKCAFNFTTTDHYHE